MTIFTDLIYSSAILIIGIVIITAIYFTPIVSGHLSLIGEAPIEDQTPNATKTYHSYPKDDCILYTYENPKDAEYICEVKQ